jgi:hypothetical protein
METQPVVINWLGNMLNWLLGLASVGVIGIFSMNVQLWVLKQRFDDHEENCLLKHAEHRKDIDDLWSAVRDKHR